MDWAGWALFGLRPRVGRQLRPARPGHLWLGGLLGMVHVAMALCALVPPLAGVHPRMASSRAGPASTAMLEPPGLLGLNYGTQTPVAHVAYGVALGVLLEVH